MLFCFTYNENVDEVIMNNMLKSMAKEYLTSASLFLPHTVIKPKTPTIDNVNAIKNYFKNMKPPLIAHTKGKK